MAVSGARILQTVDNALKVLAYLGESGEPRSLAQVTQALGLAKSVTHSLLFTLKQRGFAHQDPETREYALGLELFSLGQAAVRRLDLRRIARPAMVRLVAATGESTYLMVPGRNMSVLLDRADPPNPMRVTMEIGQEGYFHAGSSNKAILAFLPDAEIERIMQEVGLPALMVDTVTDAATLWRQIDEIRSLWHSYTEQESFEGIAGVAAPVFDWRGQVIASLGIAGLIQRLRPRRAELSRHVMSMAGAVSRQLGYVHKAGNPYDQTAEEAI